MLKGKGAIVFTIMKCALIAVGCFEYAYYFRSENRRLQMILAAILIINSFFRQLYLNKGNKCIRISQASIILDFILGAYIAYLKPIEPVILLLAPTVIEAVIAHSLIFGIITTSVALTTLVTIDTISQVRILNYVAFIQRIVVSYGLGYLLIFVISYMASLQMKEREKVERINRELEQAYKQLLDNASKLQELSIEKERNRMAREIHDTLAHTLTTVVIQLEACKKLIDIDIAKAKIGIEKSQELTRAGLGDVKRTIKALRPQSLENSSLAGALHHLIQEIEESAQVEVNYTENLSHEMELSSPVEIALFRIIQESITNAIRHGAADQIKINITEKENSIYIDISDNGRGCNHIKEGYGLKGITERVKGIGGVVNFSSTAGKGFCTQIMIPCQGGISYEN